MSSRPSPSVLRSLLSYDPDTGVLTWKPRPRSMFKSDRSCGTWNTKYAGKPAGCKDGNGYLKVGLIGGRYYAHRLAWAILNGRWPTKDLDHISGVTHDNKIINLRQVSRRENGRNIALSKTTISGVLGVCQNKPAESWRAHITIDRKLVHLGTFPTIEQATAARKEAEKKHGFHPNHGRAT